MRPRQHLPKEPTPILQHFRLHLISHPLQKRANRLPSRHSSALIQVGRPLPLAINAPFDPVGYFDGGDVGEGGEEHGDDDVVLED